MTTARNIFVLSSFKVTALKAGRLEGTAERDSLLVGSQTNLLAYDVEKNADIYYKVKGTALVAEKA